MNVQLVPPIVEPKAWWKVLSPSEKMLSWIVMLTVGSFRSLEPSSG